MYIWFMPKPLFSLRRSPGLLLLGMLALLLWGQCASLLFPTSQPGLTGWVASTDSLRTAPATLYLHLSLRNTLRQTITLRRVDGALLFNGRAHPFSATAAWHHTPLARNAETTQAVAIRLRLPADSLALLRAALAAERPVGREPRLDWQAHYAIEESSNADLWVQPSGYLRQLLPPH